jgi:CRP-like cAMP-binding protein
MTRLPACTFPDLLHESLQHHVAPTANPGKMPAADANFLLEKGEIKALRKGSVVFRQGVQPRGVFLLLQGRIKVYRNLAPGQRQIFYFHGPDDLLGCRQVITGTAYTFQAEALEDGRALFVPAEVFCEHARRSASFAQYLLEQQSREFSAWANNTALVARRSVRERLAICLLNLEQIYRVASNPTAVICLSRTDLADYAGTTLETTVRILREMKDAGLIHIRGRRMMLLDGPAMLQLSLDAGLKKVEA